MALHKFFAKSDCCTVQQLSSNERYKKSKNLLIDAKYQSASKQEMQQVKMN
jgi:hypothetical protein